MKETNDEGLKLRAMAVYVIKKLLPRTRDPINLIINRIVMSRDTVQNIKEIIAKDKKISRQTSEELNLLLDSLSEGNDVCEKQSQKIVQIVNAIDNHLASVKEIEELLD